MGGIFVLFGVPGGSDKLLVEDEDEDDDSYIDAGRV